MTSDDAQNRVPALTVGVPVHNGQQFLRSAIESILAQDYTDFELVLSDNASTDATSEICLEYARTDSRVVYRRHETNIGAAPNHNFVFQVARGRYFKWGAHDDECRPQLLSQCIDVLERRSEVVLAYPQAELIDQDGRVTGDYLASIACSDGRPHARLAHVLRTGGLGTPMYGVVRSDTLRRTGLHGSFISADLVLLAEIAILGEIYQVPDTLLRKRLHPGRSQEANQTAAEMRAWFDPRNIGTRTLLPSGYQLTLEYLRAVGRLRVRARPKLACAWTVMRQRHRGVRFRRRLGMVLRGTAAPRAAALGPREPAERDSDAI